MRITRRLEFDAGHRIAEHASQCRHLHGHRYALELTLEGEPLNRPGDAGNGMVLDFSHIKAIAYEHLVAHWDHAFLVWQEDRAVCDFLQTLPGHKTVVLDFTPTVENLARHAFTLLAPRFRAQYGQALRLARVRLYETPNCWADAAAEDCRV